jgi:hypothetical protein
MLLFKIFKDARIKRNPAIFKWETFEDLRFFLLFVALIFIIILLISNQLVVISLLAGGLTAVAVFCCYFFLLDDRFNLSALAAICTASLAVLTAMLSIDRSLGNIAMNGLAGIFIVISGLATLTKKFAS